MAHGDKGGRGGGAYKLPTSGGHSAVNSHAANHGEQVGMSGSAGKTPFPSPTSNTGQAKHTRASSPVSKAGGGKVFTPGNGTGPARYSAPSSKPGSRQP